MTKREIEKEKKKIYAKIDDNFQKIFINTGEMSYLEAQIKNQNIFTNPSEFNGKKVLKDLLDYRKSIKKEQNTTKKEFNHIFNEELYIIDLIQLVHLNYIGCLLIYTNETKPKSPPALHFIHLVIIHLYRDLISIINCLEIGHNHQAYLIFRNYIELSEIGLAIMIDDNFYKEYSKEVESEKDEIIKRQNLRASNVHKFIGKEFSKDKELKKIWERMDMLRNLYFRQASNAMHGNSFRLILECFPSEMGNNNFDENIFRFDTIISKEIKRTMFELILYIHSFIQLLLIVTVKYRKLPMKKAFGGDGEYLVYIYDITHKLACEYVEKEKEILKI